MPRISGVYSLPAGTLGTTGQPISSSAYNAFANDLVSDANAARPVAAGGTGATTAAAAAANLGLAEPIARAASNANPIINGTMRVAQRATSGAGNGYVSLDRWYNFISGAGTSTLSQVDAGVGLVLGANTPGRYLRQVVAGQTSNIADAARVSQRMDLRTFAGQTATVLFWARQESGTAPMAVGLSQFFGTGGATTVYTGYPLFTLTTSWQAFAAVLTVPTILGKTLGTGSIYAELDFVTSQASGAVGFQNRAVNICGVHMLPGTFSASDAAFYTFPSFEKERADCLPYFEKGTMLLQSPVAGTIGDSIQFAARKRTIPPIVNFTPGGSSGFNTGSIAVQALTDAGFALNGAATAPGGFVAVNWTASAEF